MFRIGEFSKMGMTTVKTLRYYDEIGLLEPEAVDDATGYRLYSSAQLTQLHRIQSLRQAGLTIDEVRRIISGDDATPILRRRAAETGDELTRLRDRLSRIEFILEGKQEERAMSYSATIKHIPDCIVYSCEMTMHGFDEYFTRIPALGEKIKTRYPDLRCAVPEYCFVINRDREWKETDNHIEFGEAVTQMKPDFDDVRFHALPATDVVSVMHEGAYEDMDQAFAFAMDWIESNGYRVTDDPRCSYIDGIWNKKDPADWLTEVQIPVAKA
ncbi:MAG: MerR family transcriptional regulator [Atopobiaceae bacterium]|jgi:DNA-binding transcriptional MerR regulator|nr:MerR family transcriptional regulator [Atopobiaceae bacterium]MCI2206893.1 MerR family transcriptional regulator [Atopobiaceae bacterium]